jgi:hypothetical protein
MNEKTYTTGQVLGITLLHRMSVYRYVKDFPTYFSPTAQQHKKGRRWNLNDLEILQAIKYLHHMNYSKQDIQEILSSGWRPPIKTIYDLERISIYFDEIFAFSEETKDDLKEIKRQLSIVNTNNRLASNLVDRIRYLGNRLYELNQELLRIKFYLRSPTKPQRRDFFSTWQEFREEVKKFWNDKDERPEEY